MSASTNSQEHCNGNASEKCQKLSSKFFHTRTAKRVEAIKRKARSELRSADWDAVGYAYDRHPDEDWSMAHLDTIERLDASAFSLDTFQEHVERAGKPVVLTGLTDDWAAHQRWTVEKVLRGYRNQTFKCGEDDDGYSVKLKLKYYVDYASTTKDDSPLYIFDSGFGDRTKTSKLLSDYEVPPMFQDDLFRYATEQRRPPYRWFVMGPARSGTAIHIDPMGTSAWNALIVGHKKWCLIHPSASKQLVRPSTEERGALHSDEAITWFRTVYRRVLSPQWPADRHPVIHAVQKAGEVIFVPSGWWHVVLNLDMTIAVTQNFASVVNLCKVWPKTVRTRRALSIHWLKALQRERPELMATVRAIDEAHGFATPWDLSEPFDSSSSSSSSSSSDESTDGENERNQRSSQSRSKNHRQLHGGGGTSNGGVECSSTRAMAARPRHQQSSEQRTSEVGHSHGEARDRDGTVSKKRKVLLPPPSQPPGCG
uniref:JmjC domain-containing protein n=1 Tax=Globodera rostochiensis TaxID=31243 RepID=A0A914I2Y8_GLORO